ncbi:MAG TPA: N-acetylmuramic acid 6-phosphate etherase [Acidobacteriaceae bacterium]|nr:N-acetylmuramic acid 6-phosphate etherase [Acidobacteriaceae bacterium]
MDRLEELLTEARNPATEHIDQMSTLEMLEALNAAERSGAEAVLAELKQIAAGVDGITRCFQQGGRLFYQGAGTSGRLGVLDASECPPTFNVDAGKVIGVIAGGDRALRSSVERAEDDPGQGAQDLKEREFSGKDAVVGIAASGRTPYVLGGVDYARSLGALTIGISCVPHSELARKVEIAITPAVGPEVITGSTRMRAGTATKLVLNMLSTGAMIRLGLVYGNLMVNLQPSNEKLKDRAARIVASATGVDALQAAALLAEAGSVPVAIVMQKLGLTRAESTRRLELAGGQLRAALGETAERGSASGSR